MKSMRLIFLSSLLILFKTSLLAQTSITFFDNTLIENNNYSYKKIIEFSKSNNAYDFMAMGYFLDANNTMFIATHDKKYLEQNLVVVKNVLDTYIPSSKNYKPWLMHVSEKNQNHVVNGQEHLISEGYFFRYLGEFIFILKKYNLYCNEQNELFNGLKYSFDKWNKRSLDEYKDQSLLFQVRFNVGANWSVVALYIDEFLNRKDSLYKSFYTEFNKQLKISINNNSKRVNDKFCYLWNSTYPSKFTNKLKRQKKYPVVYEDVTHANHTVNFILTTIKLNKNLWNIEDLGFISNTIQQIVWEPLKFNFTDNLNGTSSKNLHNTGWKQSDGFMKIMIYDKTLYPIYSEYYSKNKDKILNSSLSLQFQANFILYDFTYHK